MREGNSFSLCASSHLDREVPTFSGLTGGGGVPTLAGGVHTFSGGGVPTFPGLDGGYLPWQGGTYLGGRVPTLANGVPTLVGGYLPWPMGYLPWWGYLPWQGGYLASQAGTA